MNKVKYPPLHILYFILTFTCCSVNANEIFFASWGGAYQRALENAWLDPFSEATKIEIYRDTEPEIAKIRAMVDTENVQWDIVTGGGETLMKGIEYNLFTKITADMVDQTSILDSVKNQYGVPTEIYSTVIAFSKDKFPDEKPKTFSDFWDIDKFPGRRTLPDDPAAVLEAALLADGVNKAEIYKLLNTEQGLERALNKIREIKDHITFWWSSGAQPVQALGSGEVDLALGWNGRFQAGIDNGLNIEMAWSESISHVGYMMIPRGAPNQKQALEFLNYITQPQIQAKISNFISYGPAGEEALKYIDKETMIKLPSTKERINNTLFMDISWWANHSTQALEEYLLVIQE